MYREQVPITRHGTPWEANSLLLFRAVPGKAVYLLGSDPFEADWANIVPDNGTAWQGLPKPVSIACVLSLNIRTSKLAIACTLSGMDEPKLRLACAKKLWDAGFKLTSKAFNENAQLWLGIKVDADDEMTPRVRIVAVPYAMRAKTAEVAEEVADAARRGSVLFEGFELRNDGTTYVSIAKDGPNGTVGSETQSIKTLMPRDAEISNLFIFPEYGDTNPGWGVPDPDFSVTATIRVNGADTPLAVTHVVATSSFDPVGNTTDRVTVNQGDMVTLKTVLNSGTVTGVVGYRMSLEIK